MFLKSQFVCFAGISCLHLGLAKLQGTSIKKRRNVGVLSLALGLQKPMALQIVRKSIFLGLRSPFLSFPFPPHLHHMYRAVSCTRVRTELLGQGVHEVYINGDSTDLTLISYRSKGRPRTAIDKEQLEAFLKLKIPLSEIASALHVSRPTVYKAIRENNINY